MKKILFVLDKLELKYFEFNKLVTNFWMVKGLLERQNDVYVTIPSNLSLKADIPYTKCYKSFVQDDNIFYKNNSIEFQLDEFDLVIFRPDPPVDIDYINATYIFDFVKKAEVINSPRAIRDFNEKLHTVYFKEFMSENTVTSSLNDIEKFLALHKEIVLKPLNRCFGAGVMYLYETDDNDKIIENSKKAFRFGNRTIGVKRYYSARQNDIELKKVIHIHRNLDIVTDMAAVIDNTRYKIEQVQHYADTNPPVTVLSLSQRGLYKGVSV